jgi:hypothetical protein
METTRKTTEQEKEVMEFLNFLRNTGATNMFGAVPYILAEFDIQSSEAKRILVLWMDNFNEDGNYEQVKI